MPIELTQQTERMGSAEVRRGPRGWALALLLALALPLALQLPTAAAATFTVINTDDSGMGSLRAALASANVNGGDSIVFDASLNGSTITLNTAPLTGKKVTFVNAANITINYAPPGAGSHSGLTVASGVSILGVPPSLSLTSTSSTAMLTGISAASGTRMTLQELSGTLSVSGLSNVSGVSTPSGVTITNGISGSLGATTSASQAYGINSSTGSIILGGISGSLSATSTTGSASALNIVAVAGITITGGISGNVTASTTSGVGSTSALSASGISITGGISGSVSATTGGAGSANGLNAKASALTLNGGLTSTGSIRATTQSTGGSTAAAINGGAITFTNGGIAGTIFASTLGTGNASGVSGNTLSIADGISGSITATTATGRAAGLFASGALTVGGISGAISATSTDNTYSHNYGAYGIRSAGPLSLGIISGSVSASGPSAFSIDTAGSTTNSIGNISGTISATSGADGLYSSSLPPQSRGFARGISNSGSGSLTIGAITGSVSATSTGNMASGERPYAAGLWSSSLGALTTGNISGTISATSSGIDGNAYGLYSAGKVTTGAISGSINATANGDGMAAAVVATFGSDLTISGTLSGTNSSASGEAYAIWNKDPNSGANSSGVDNITLLSGARLLGKVDLSAGADTVTFNSSNVTISGLMDGGSNTDTLVLANSGTFSGYSIANFERLTKSGSGTWALKQNLDLGATGVTTVSGGILALNAILTSPTVIVNSGATLSGAGTIVGNLTNNVSVSPGNSIGTLTIMGNYTQTTGSTLNICMDRTGSSLLDVSGTAVINPGSTLSVAASLSPGYYASGQKFTFLKAAGGITGSFDTVSVNGSVGAVPTTGSPSLNFTLAKTATEYQWVLNRTAYTPRAGTRNGFSAAQALGLATVSPSTAMQSGLGLVDFTPAGNTPSMLDQLGPAVYGSMSQTSLSTLRLFTNAANSQLQGAGQARATAPGWNLSLADFLSLVNGANASTAARIAASERIMAAGPLGLEPVNLLNTSDQNMYLVPIGTYTRQESGDYSTGYKGLTYGLTGGMLIPLDERFGMAVQLGYAHSALDFLNSSSTADIDHFVAGVFGMYAADGYYGVANMQAGLAHSTMRRRVDFGTSTVTATGYPLTYSLNTGVDVGRDYELRQGIWAGPVAGLQAARVTSTAFTENGAEGLNLSVAEDTAYSLKSTLGVRLRSEHEADPGAKFTTEFSLRWAHEFLDRSRDIRASFAEAPGASFTGLTNAADADAILLGAGVTYKPENRFAYFAKYNGEVSGERRQAHSVMFGLNVEF